MSVLFVMRLLGCWAAKQPLGCELVSHAAGGGGLPRDWAAVLGTACDLATLQVG